MTTSGGAREQPVVTLRDDDEVKGTSGEANGEWRMAKGGVGDGYNGRILDSGL